MTQKVIFYPVWAKILVLKSQVFYNDLMDILIKIVFFIIFAAAIFGRSYIESSVLYWSLYVIMGILLGCLWWVMFWVSKKKVVEVLGKQPEFEIFAGRIPLDVRADLDRGRFCISDGKFILVQKKNGKFQKTWELPVSEVKSIGFGRVGGSYRYGFILHTEDGKTEFTCGKIKKEKDNLFKTLGWK